jgi:hypothetical protein
MSHLQVFRHFKSVGVCRSVPLHVGPVVVKIVVNRFSGSSQQVFEVEPRGFEPLTSAVQSQVDNVVIVRHCSKTPAKWRFRIWRHSCLFAVVRVDWCATCVHQPREAHNESL